MYFVTKLLFTVLPLLVRAASGNYLANERRDGVTHLHDRSALTVKDADSSDRIRRGQVDTGSLRKLPTRIRKRNVPSSLPIPVPPPTCAYAGANLATMSCQQQDTSDGCNEQNYYHVSGTSVTLLKGATFQANGHINFAYIPYADYKGVGSYRSPPSNWHISQGHIQFDPNNGQPGGVFIGASIFPFEFGATLPITGYCIVWVQVSDYNVHFGENGMGPVCVCPPSSVAQPIQTL